MISFDFSSHCSGCYACVDVCPKQCIRIIENKRGFVIPEIDKPTCVNCGLCERVCPIITTPKLHNPLSVHCAYNKDDVEREIGSSGSIMLLLAKYILSKGGVVYGAAFDEDLQLRHLRAENYDQLIRQSKSKYIQSNLQGVFKKIKKDVDSQLLTMFVGTPCQTQAIRNYLNGKNDEYLLLVDFICHGVPSQSLFNQSIKEFERKNKCQVVDFSFREKSSNRLRNYKISYLKDGQLKIERGVESQFPYYCGFLKYITFRDSCYECKFARSERTSDLTLGDMWGYENVTDFQKGYSLIYINSSKGEDIFSKIKNSVETSKLSIGDPITYNFAYNHCQNKDFWQRVFAFMQLHCSYSVIERFLFREYKNVGILHKIVFLIMGKINKYYIKKYKND
ncbi:MAG: Coenzyme F420 hydrogenase/dehydrogenase, beta subunit C-terminal domain [Bacteroidales bacterium]|nr:Coenzyme F420 hydrogenase/dehydrogenase, beta subunit C-terminal domain [Bacteroidales bacterium]